MSSILYECRCGKVFQFSAKYAGRRARCSQCQRIYRIPQSEKETVVDQLLESTSEVPETSDFTLQNPVSSSSSDKENGVKSSESTSSVLSKSRQGKTQENFKILGVISQGGMGTVCVARDEKLERLVAVKKIRKEFRNNPRLHKRLEMEAKITAYLDHPGIVPVYALEKDQSGNPYFAMRRIRGVPMNETIEKYHKTKNANELSELLRHFVVVCQIVAYAHSEQVVHRDIKPSNLMIGKFGATFVMDWGLAKRYADWKVRDELSLQEDEDTSSRLTHIEGRVGTRGYKAPEYLMTGLSNPSNDIYALGVVLYNILTNKLPYDEKKSERLVACLEEPKAPCEISKSISKPLSAICMKAISKDVTQRYQSALALADDVQKWLENRTVSVYDYSFVEKLLLSLRRQ